MQFCADHWDRLRAQIEARGLAPLVSASPEVAVAQLADEIERGEPTKVNFDPLMQAHWSIIASVMRLMELSGANPLVLMVSDPPDGGCPLCHVNRVHRETCRGGGCSLDREHGFDYMLDAAASDALTVAEELGLVGTVGDP